MNLNIPNLISLLRIFFIAPILILLNFEVAHTTYFALIIFLLASLTDFLDGYVARKTDSESSLGALLDLIADKLFISIILIYLVTFFTTLFYLIPVLLIVSREMSILAVRQHYAEKQLKAKTVPSQLGKFKTFSQIIAISVLILSTAHPQYTIISISILWVSAIIGIYSFFDYITRWKRY